MTMSSTPTLIFVHGAWHSPAYWMDVTSRCQQQGYRCLVPQLEFCGTEKPVQSLAGSIRQVQDLIEAETKQKRNVILINHSFGGAVGCSSVKGFSDKDTSRLGPGSGRVIGIVQVCAFTPPSGKSLYNMIDIDNAFHHSGPDGWEVIDSGDPINLFYNDIPSEDAKIRTSRLLKQSTATLKDEENIHAGWAEVPVWYLLCTRDQAIPIQIQEMMVSAAQNAGASFTTRSLDSGHSPFLSKPAETTGFILEAVQAFTTPCSVS
ncbi:hypothetical protein N7532_005224 [Penicillium argentinense]|uniref:AB hydrolase-1 domain-containing protein n=1 Tax=Penicillium argentinense TaxID=1131581 RepID=A0A9W9FDH3_9EURO|nr:uncharacterized protein N7532_005224 [Penicillium argentinense]KAJ5098223.1 hypothetical protein N7532_005224 [Penicillium argentinense]